MKIFTLFVLAIATLMSCNKGREIRTVYVPDAMKNAYLFQRGSWWVYYDTVSTAMDSVVIDSIEHGFYRDMDQAGRYEPWHDREYYNYAVQVHRLSGVPLSNPPIRHFLYHLGSESLFGHSYPFRGTYGSYCLLPEVKFDSSSTFRNVDVFINQMKADTYQMAVPGIGIIMRQQDSAHSSPGYGNEFYYRLVRWHVVR